MPARERGTAARPDARLAAEAQRLGPRLWDKARRNLGRVPFLEDALAAWFCAIDPRAPLVVKAALLGAIAYFVVPTDLIPDFIAGLGYGDDASVLMAALGAVRRYIRPDHRARARAALEALARAPSA
ncbi:MAG: DUF1232 domain-containing protein [Alphaproteobacteria bacterium]|nr:DUF1232 domain-containing protein [Alphaproteobacteria bacterium]